MAKGVVVVTAQKIKKRRKREKVVSITLVIILIILLFSYFILNIVYNEGCFTISMDKNTYLKSNLVMYESMNDRSSVIKLSARKLEFMDNISIKWLPEDINKNYEGSHNGDNYMAFSFYLENQGDEIIDYWYSGIVEDVVKNVITTMDESAYAKSVRNLAYNFVHFLLKVLVFNHDDRA